jgi:hypothetical protein
VKCVRCGHDSRFKDRPNRTCPRCKGRFAFEPREGAKVTDQAFQNAVNRVSGDGTLRWGAEHLYYEICRRRRPRIVRISNIPSRGAVVGVAVVAVALLVIVPASRAPIIFFGTLLTLLGLIFGLLWLRRWHQKTVPLGEAEFRTMLASWTRTHGTPPGLIERPALPPRNQPRRVLESDLTDYSFDRAVICDRTRTVDLLLANNFHFENNCAVLSIEGYPPGPFETVRTMLKRNPRLQVFALHDATVDGCTLADRLTSDPSWFAGQVPVIDVGLRPGHAGPFRGLWLPAQMPFVAPGSGIKPAEAEWLAQYSMELAVIRPDQVLKRLFRAMNRRTADDDGGDDSGDVLYFGDGDGRDEGREEGESYVIEDSESFSDDASADDGGADSFG